MDTNANQQHLPGRRSHRPRFDIRPVASPELDVAPWWGDDANVDGCEAVLRTRATRCRWCDEPAVGTGASTGLCDRHSFPEDRPETEHEYAQRLLREHGCI